MSIRHLDSFFDPASVAVIGASAKDMTVGATVWRNLRAGGFVGARWAVNPKYTQLDGEPCFASVKDLPAVPELAVIATPAATVAGLVAALGALGTKAVLVLSAGLDTSQKQAVLDAARPHLLRVMGPNSLGLLSPPVGLNASFAPESGARTFTGSALTPGSGEHSAASGALAKTAKTATGGLALVAQSGALSTAMLDWAAGRGIVFSRCVALGEQIDVDFADLLDWLASDGQTRAILLYIESIQGARKFMSASRAAARNKPVLVVKAGRSPQGQAAAASHTGALAASDLVFDAAIRRAGMLRVQTMDELFVAAEALAHLRGRPLMGAQPQSDEVYSSHDDAAPGATSSGVFTTTVSASLASSADALTVVTNGGGAGVLAADAAAAAGLTLAPLAATTRARLDDILPKNWSRSNPVDIIGDAPVQRYVQTLSTLLEDPAAGSVLFIHAPTAIVPSADIARALVPLAQQAKGRLLSCWLGDGAVREARQIFRNTGVACYDTAEQAVAAFVMMATYRSNQLQLTQAPLAQSGVLGQHGALGAHSAPLAQVQQLVDTALAEGREWLTEPESKALLAACGVPVVATRRVDAAADSVVAAAQALGYPVALKILSPQISHKSDVGGVALNLENEAGLRDAVAGMLRRVALQRPDAQISGFTVQTMVRWPDARELIAGIHIDPLFGPVLMFGQGGRAVEVVADRAIALPPLNLPLARAVMARTRVSRLLAAWREVPEADQDAVAGVLVALSDLLAAEPRIAELDINPLLADAQGVLALDARVRVSAKAPGGAARFAIRPYPAQWVQTLPWQGRTLTLRPIRPDDEARHLAFLARLDLGDIRMRVFYSRRSIARSELARMTQIDYEREMAFVATASSIDPSAHPSTHPSTEIDIPGEEETLGVARALRDPDNQDAEFGIVVRSDLKGLGLGGLLMNQLINYWRAQGTQRLVGQVLRENTAMLAFMRKMGFVADVVQPEPDATAIHLLLQTPVQAPQAPPVPQGPEGPQNRT